MWRATLAGLRVHRLRLAMAALATVIGVAFVAGTLILGDTLQADTERTVTANTRKVDVAVLASSGLRALPQSAVDDLAALDGVADVQGAVEGAATLLGQDGRPLRDQPVAASATMRTSMAQGSAPASADEVGLAETTARNGGYGIGDRIGVLDAEGRERTMEVTGIVDTQGEGDMALRGAAVFTRETAQEVTGEDGYAGIYLTSAGPAPDALRSQVAETIGDGSHEVITGRQWADMKAAGSGLDPAVISAGLLMVALVALMVSGLVIFNTFTILVAQRKRELALMRCVGASRGQVFGSVVAESAAVGSVASLAGLALGVGAGYGAIPVFNAFGNDIPYSVVTVTPLTLTVSLAAGIAVTVASAALPARAATRVAPIAALNSTEERSASRMGSVRGIAGVLLCSVGAVVAAATALSPLTGSNALIAVVGGGMAFFLGIVALGPVIVRPVIRVVGYAPGRLLGTPGRLAVSNARRNPKRAATTVIALAVGVTLMTGVSVATESFSESVSVGVEDALPVDFIVTAPGGGRGEQIPPSVVDDLQEQDGVTEVAAQRESVVEIDGRSASIASVVIGGPIDTPELVDGAPLAELGPGQIAVSPDRAEEFGVGIGDELEVRGEGGAFTLEVASLVSGVPFPPFYVTEAEFADLFGDRGYGAVLLNVDPALLPEDARSAVEAATADFPTASITGTDDARGQLEDTLSNFVMIVAGLLGLAVVISLIGIANTLSLSVVERTRESALLRALGLTRRQLGRMLTVEALVLGLVGACLGVVIGAVFGLAAVSVIRSDLVMVVPYGQIALIVAGSGLAGMVAAFMPARRAARTSIVASLAAE